MGYFGPGSFDNDEALDWLASIGQPCSHAMLGKPMAKYERYMRDGVLAEDVLTPEQIERVISAQVAFWRKNPPTDWACDADTFDDWLAKEESERRAFYNSGRYLDREYGPVEEALAAAELIAAICGAGEGHLPDEAVSIAKTCKVPPNSTLLRRAIDVVEHIRKNDRYRRMRASFLKAFPQVSGGSDHMAAVDDLLARLQSLRR